MMFDIKYKLLITALLISNIGWTQSPSDNWFMGYHEKHYEEERYSIVYNIRTNEIDSLPDNINFESTMASISDDDGNLLLYTNGCAIYNNNHNIINDGEEINLGDLWDIACPDYGYLLPDGAMFLSDPKDNNSYYLLHLKGIVHPKFSIISDQLLYSKINITANNEQGEIKEKNTPVSTFAAESFAVTKHGNGRDWWIVVPQRMSNQYHTYLLDPYGVHFIQTQKIGSSYGQDKCNFTGNSTFSPDGATLSRITSHCGMMVIKFDRCSGILFNAIHLPEVYTDFKHIHSAFSSDSKFIYILHQGRSDFNRNSQRKLIRLDLKNLGISLDPFYTQTLPLGVAPERIMLTPNNGLVISEINSKPYLHTITESNMQDTILFNPKEINLPMLNARTMNYFPNYSLGKIRNSICDTISSNTSIIHDSKMKLVPNPVNGIVQLFFNTSEKVISIEIIDNLGKIVHTRYFNNPSSPISIDLDQIISGHYYMKVKTQNNHLFLPLQKL